MTEEPGDPEVTGTSSERPPLDLLEALARAGPVDWTIIGALVLSLVMSVLSYPLAAFLLAHLKTHLLTTASLSAMLTGGAAVFSGREPLVLVLVLGVIGLGKFDPFFFLAGRRWGDDVARFFVEQGTFKASTVARTERWLDRFGPPLLPISYFTPFPSRLVMVLLGASGVSWVAYVLADLVGTLAWASVFIALGHHFHTQVDHIAHVVNHYTLLVGGGLTLLVVLVAFARVRRQLRTTPS